MGCDFGANLMWIVYWATVEVYFDEINPCRGRS